jgi:hypothetical protein
MLIGTCVAILLSRTHVISRAWALVTIFMVVVGGLTQSFLSRRRSQQ